MTNDLENFLHPSIPSAPSILLWPNLTAFPCAPHRGTDIRSSHSLSKPPNETAAHVFILLLWGIHYTGLDCMGRFFISDRTHLVFDFHQIVDGLKEVELGGSSCISSFPHLAQLTGLTISQHRYHQERHRPRLLCESVSLGLTRASPLRPYIC